MRRDDGSMSTELVLLTPVLLVLLGFVVMTGRIGEVDGAVRHAAQQAARAASLGTAAGAQTAAESTAQANLDALGVGCANLDVAVDTASFEPGGLVSVAVTCSVELGDIAFSGLPGHRSMRAEAVEVVDRYRGNDR